MDARFSNYMLVIACLMCTINFATSAWLCDCTSGLFLWTKECKYTSHGVCCAVGKNNKCQCCVLTVQSLHLFCQVIVPHLMKKVCTRCCGSWLAPFLYASVFCCVSYLRSSFLPMSLFLWTWYTCCSKCSSRHFIQARYFRFLYSLMLSLLYLNHLVSSSLLAHLIPLIATFYDR